MILIKFCLLTRFNGNLKNTLIKISKTVWLSNKLHQGLPRPPLLAIHVSHIGSYLDYENIDRNSYEVWSHLGKGDV